MNHRPRKRFGQNFLHDKAVIQKIVAAINPQPLDPLLEIGPGKGALTEPLLQHVSHLDVIEIDRDLAALLDEKFNREKQRITLHQQDALAFDFSVFQHDKLRIVGNLPYNISTPLLFHLLDYADNIRDMTFMLQKEVVDRMAAVPGSKSYGRLTVMMQVSCDVVPLFTVGPGAFQPAPKVDSAVVRIIPNPHRFGPIQDRAIFSSVVKNAFSQRRKTLRNALKNLLTREELQHLQVDPGTRAENLAIEDFIKLANWLATRNAGTSEAVDKSVH